MDDPHTDQLLLDEEQDLRMRTGRPTTKDDDVSEGTPRSGERDFVSILQEISEQLEKIRARLNTMEEILGNP